MATDREAFCTVLAHGPLLRGDAIIMLCGEDATPRLNVATELMLKGGAGTIVLSGGRDSPPRWLGAERLAPVLMGKGVAHNRILLDNASQNTREQAVNCIALAVEKDWHRLLLVSSPYHSARAFLTFLKAIQEVKAEETLQLINVPSSQVPWGQPPEGMDATRFELLATEWEKIDAYEPHVALYRDGLAYLRWWEGK